MRRFSNRVFTFGVFWLLGCGALRAGVIYSTFDNPPGTAFTRVDFYVAQGASVPGGYSGLASPFTSGGEFDVTQIDAVLGGAANPVYTKTVDVGIYTDAGGLPGALIGSMYQATPPQNFINADVVAISGITGVPLHSGQTYWLVILPDSTSTNVNWVYGAGSGVQARTTDGSTWFHPTASVNSTYFDVVGTEVPEPGTFTLLGLGSTVVALLRRRAAIR